MFVDDDTPMFVISVAAQLSGLHPQTLRAYDRLGLVSPDRTPGRGRRYSARDIEQLRQVQRLSQEEGVNLAGIKRILDLEDQVDALQERLREMAEELDAVRATIAQQVAAAHASHRRELVPLRSSTVFAWQSTTTGTTTAIARRYESTASPAADLNGSADGRGGEAR